MMISQQKILKKGKLQRGNMCDETKQFNEFFFQSFDCVWYENYCFEILIAVILSYIVNPAYNYYCKVLTIQILLDLSHALKVC